jgi:dienelactone hydrolase
MATIVLFHSALGLTQSVRRFAHALGEDGHDVHTPDLFDGETFANVEDGARKRDALGIPELLRRTTVAVDALPADLVYAGFSMGAASAQYLALTRPGARGAVLMHGALTLAALGATEWPQVPLQIHSTEADPWVDAAAVDDLKRNASADVFRYPGKGHLFAERDDADYDPRSAALMERRVRDFVGSAHSSE